MKSEIIYTDFVIVIENTESSAPEKHADLVVSEAGETKNKTILEIRTLGETATIAFLWSHFSENAKFSHHLSEENKILFAGAGSLSTVIDLSTLEIKDLNFPDQFWSWECVKGNILELGELNCRLYTPSGSKIGEAEVDPPYEYKTTENSIEFSSIVGGKTEIAYKKD